MDGSADERRFIDQIMADPDDPDLPLVYADWLDEHGQPDRAELIRVELRPPNVSGDEWTRFRERRDELEERCAEPLGRTLRKKIELRWSAGLLGVRVRREARLTAADLRKMAALPHLTELLGIERLTPEVLEQFGRCPNVRRLGLYGYAELTPEQFEALGTLSHVESLSLSYGDGRVGEGLRHVAGMTGLKELDFERRDVGDAEIGDLLAALTGLEVLNLADTRVTDDGLASLPQLTNLRELVLHHTAITDATLERLGSLPRLISLDVGDTKVKDPIACVLRLPRLRKVGLRRLTQITDASLPDLMRMPDLVEVDLRLTRVTRFRLAPLLPQTKWKKVRLEMSIGDSYDAEQREIDAFEEFCKQHGIDADVDWE
jgi:uncharacterized protein (TIGR02996 family)